MNNKLAIVLAGYGHDVIFNYSLPHTGSILSECRRV
jgi:hypothetical protein